MRNEQRICASLDELNGHRNRIVHGMFASRDNVHIFQPAKDWWIVSGNGKATILHGANEMGVARNLADAMQVIVNQYLNSQRKV